MKRRFFTILLLLCSLSAICQLRFNEIVQSNFSGYFVDDEYPDSWVEIVNEGDTAVNLAGWRIGDSARFVDAWELSSVTIEPGEAVVICCDKAETELHTDFRLDVKGGFLFLFSPEKKCIERLEYPEMIDCDIAYARLADGSWSVVSDPTPEETENAPAAQVLPDPEFSMSGGVWVSGNEIAKITVTVPEEFQDDPNIKLCLTIDGSEPDLSDKLYRKKFSFSISYTMVVRARLMSLDSSYAVRPPKTETFVVLKEPTDLDVISIAGNPKCFYDTVIGIFSDNYNTKSKSRRPVNIEYFKSGEGRLFNQKAEVRLHGGVTRSYPQKSLTVYAAKRFGSKTFDGEMWDDKPNVTSCESFIMRNGGNSFYQQRFNDQVMQDLIGHTYPETDRQACTEALYYINGRFMGIIDVRERSNEDYIYANYPTIHDFDMLENYTEVKSGTDEAMREFIDYYNSPDVTTEGLEQRMDIENFMNSFVLHLFAHDTDHPQNNIVAWKPNKTGAKWRWVIKDVDRSGIWSMNDQVHNDYLTHIDNWIKWYPDSISRPIKLFQLMYTLPDLREKLINKTAVSLGDWLCADEGKKVITGYVDLCKNWYLKHAAVYFDDEEEQTQKWLDRNEYWYETWWPTRINAVYANLASRFELGDTFNLHVDNLDELQLSINDVPLTLESFNGKWFTQHQLTLSIPDGQYGLWICEATDSIGNITEQCFKGHTYINPVIPEGTKSFYISVESVSKPAPDFTGITETTSDETPDNTTIYDLQGRRVAHPRRNNIYISNNQKRLYQHK